MAASGVLTSPNYPNGYDNGIDSCIFTIIGPGDVIINLRVDDFRLEGGPSSCPWDYVEVRDGNSESSSLIGKFCGSNIPPNVIQSTQGHLWIK